MNILFYFTFGYSLQSWKESGTLDRELTFYRNLAEKYKVKFLFVTYGDEKDEQLIHNEDFFEVIPIYKYIKFKNSKIFRYLQSLYFPFKLKKIRSDFDIIKQNQLQGVWSSIILKLLTKKPLIVRTGYDVLTFTKMEKKSFIKIFVYKLITRTAIKYSNIYTVTSEIDKYFLENTFGPSKRIELRPNWIILEDERKKTEMNKLISIGRLEKQKNYPFLIDLFSESNIEIDVYGLGNEKKSLVEYSKLKNTKINFLGRVENKILLSKLQKHKFYITTSSFEGNPKTVLEAMSRGCVVFASKIPSHEEIINHLEDGFLFDFNEKNTLDNIKEVMGNKELVKKISINARLRVAKKNNIKNLLKQEMNDYQSIIN